MVAPHAEDRFYEPDYYYGKQSTDITKRYGQVPSHAYDPKIKNAPTAYYVIPYHDMSDKFRNRVYRDRRIKTKIPENPYYGRQSTEITSPTKFAHEGKESPFLPWPETSTRIGDISFNRSEYLHPLGKTRPSPMDDYVPILRDQRTGKVINNPSPPPSRKESRRRMLGLTVDGCHSSGSPCRSESASPAQRGDYENEQVDDDIGHSRRRPKSRPHNEYDQDVSRSKVEATLPCVEHDYRPKTAPAEVSPGTTQTPRRRKSYLSSTYGNLSSAVQPVGGRSGRDHADEMEQRAFRNEVPETPHSYVPGQRPDYSRTVYTLGSMTQQAQPVGGRASILNMIDMEQSQRDLNRSGYAEASASYSPPSSRIHRPYPPQHHSFSQEPSPRSHDDEAMSVQKFDHRDDRSTTSSQSSRRRSQPPKYDQNLPPEKLRGRPRQPPKHDPDLLPEKERSSQEDTVSRDVRQSNGCLLPQSPKLRHKGGAAPSGFGLSLGLSFVSQEVRPIWVVQSLSTALTRSRLKADIDY
ncbi:hypothetical protein R1sor_013004 [Riccia sorocarpa]|uniref:Uncharacterized protein n=1 Tax=Riccia sorocarpa TaxID=122646 RepID=A0ABD3H8K0_9MARC